MVVLEQWVAGRAPTKALAKMTATAESLEVLGLKIEVGSNQILPRSISTFFHHDMCAFSGLLLGDEEMIIVMSSS